MDLQAYNELLDFAGFNTHQEALNARLELEGRSTHIVSNSPLNNGDDLERIIHMVYAWMPTMLKTFNRNIGDMDLDELHQLSIQARSRIISEADENRLFISLAKLTNNHMVGASKVLTVIHAEAYPIFDSKVVNSWRVFWAIRPQYYISEIHNLPVTITEQMITEYRYYISKLQEWANNIDRSTRDFEFLFWKAG